ncbi:hypothetical protein niasHT_001451 [Heterodera trifolii]|uniref:Ubiquitin-like domain-containing protein n=1 Tax=Heterodera trifolii TaxID=157864 RepID=A0ABD2M4H1_9BILA
MSTIDGTAATFQLTIRCAMQSFPDHTLECPADWNVLQLKTHLAEECVTKPDPSRQRLIYAGRCLDNEQKVREVLAQRRDGIVRNEVAEKQVIHMVCIGAKSSSTNAGSNTTPSRENSAGAPTANAATSEGLRHRGTHNGGGQPNASSNVPLQQQQQYFATFHPPQQQSYEAWMSAYQNYMNQMAAAQFYQQQPYASAAHMAQQQQQAYAFFGGQMPPTVQHNHQQLFATPMVPQPPHFGAPAQQNHPHNNMMMMAVPHQQHQQQQRAADAPAMVQQQQQQQRMVGGGGGVGEAAAAAGAGADLLDIVYKSVRFALLAMVLYVYASLERFFLVLAVVAFFWFVHRRRNQQQQQRDNAAAAHENGANNAIANALPPQPALPQPQQNQRPNDNNTEADGPPAATTEAEDTTPTASDNVPHQPSAWNVFFTVVQSFFTSLVPNPMPAPLDIN